MHVHRSSSSGAGALPILIALVALVVIGLLGAGLWWSVTTEPFAPKLPAPRPAPTAGPESTPGSGSGQATGPAVPSGAGPERKASLESVKALLASGADADTLVLTARGQLAAGEPGPAFLLLRAAARNGSGEAAHEIALFYDPDGFGNRPTPFAQANVVKAMEWYAEAVRGGHAPAAEGLEKSRNAVAALAEAGDASASAALKRVKSP